MGFGMTSVPAPEAPYKSPLNFSAYILQSYSCARQTQLKKALALCLSSTSLSAEVLDRAFLLKLFTFACPYLPSD